MAEERFMVTGALGCIGAWTIKNLLRQEVPTAIFDTGKGTQRLKLILEPEELERIKFIHGDVCDLAGLEQAIRDFGVTNIIHLAALQLPFCKADPHKGAMVNVVGTVNIFEAAKHNGIRQIVYASSTAVYGVSEEYPEGPLPNDAPLLPRSHYGVYKQANEGTAKIYWMDDGISSIGLRPYVVYGAGRDQGMTSTPTKAMMAASIGQAYNISFGGYYCFQYGDDVGKMFIQASRTLIQGAEVFNLGGPSVSTSDVIACIERTIPDLRGKMSYEKVSLPFPEYVDNLALSRTLGNLPNTSLQRGVEETIQIFQRALNEKRITRDELDKMIKQ